MSTPTDSRVTDDELRHWLRDNLKIEVEIDDMHGPGNSVTVGLRFKGEHDSFTSARINIPESA